MIASIQGREGEGVGGGLSKFKKMYCHFAIDGVGMFEACMCTFKMGVERIGTKRRTHL